MSREESRLVNAIVQNALTKHFYEMPEEESKMTDTQRAIFLGAMGQQKKEIDRIIEDINDRDTENKAT
jgi:hypothetical protein